MLHNYDLQNITLPYLNHLERLITERGKKGVDLLKGNRPNGFPFSSKDHRKPASLNHQRTRQREEK